MFNTDELCLLYAACMSAACISRQSNTEQADEFHALAEKCHNKMENLIISTMDIGY